MKPNETTTSDSTGNNTLLAVSGLPELYKIRNYFVTTLPTGEVTAWNMICWAKDFTLYMDEIIHEAEKAAGASGAVDTATCGVDDNGWHCQRGGSLGVDSECLRGCVLARNSCEG